MNNLRKTYLSAIGDIPWGSHICQFYSTKEDLLDVLVPFMRAGLENNEYCMWIVSEPPSVEETLESAELVTSNPVCVQEALNAMRRSIPEFDKYLERGQIEVLPHTAWYLKDGYFDMKRVLDGWVERAERALARGFDGMRVSGNTVWLEKTDWKKFSDYEEAINTVIDKYPMIALCTYSLEKCGATEILEVAGNHRCALVRKGGRWISIESTERRAAEEKLMEAERRYRTIFEESPDGILIIDPATGLPLMFNDAVCANLGYSREEFARMKVDDYEFSETSGEVRAHTEKVMKNGRGDFETRHRAKDGGVHNVLVSVKKIEFLGRPALHAIFRDITELRAAEEALRISEKVFRTVFAESPIGIELYDRAGRLIEVNRSCLDIFGLNSIEQVKGFSLFEDPNITEEAKKSLSEGRMVRYESAFDFEKVKRLRLYETSKSGTAWLDVLITPLGGIGYLVQVQDITRRREAEESLLRKSAEALAEAQRIARIGSWDWDIINDMIFWSDEMYKIFGLEPGEGPINLEKVLGRIHPGDREEFRRALERSIREGAPIDMLHRIVLPDGEVRTLHSRGEVIRDSQGRAARMIGTRQDVTERKRAEDELRKAFAELERSNRDLEQFAYMASHDLQEPLRMVISYINLLDKRYRGILDAKAERYMHFIAGGAERMQNLVNDLLAYSRVATRGGQPEAISSEGVLMQVLEDLSMAIRESGAVIRHENLPEVRFDPVQLAQLLQNLLSNAIKFRKPGERPEVRIRAERKRGEWVFSVSDNGIGIDPRFSEKIFVIFQRLHGSEYEGTGIGLAICKKIIERHGGRIWFASEPGKGSEFYFTVPDRRSDGTNTEGGLGAAA